MERNLTDKTILIVQGSLIAGNELADAFGRSGARVHLTANVINAFSLLRHVQFDGALVDQGLHNAAFDLCSELQDLNVPYIWRLCENSPYGRTRATARSLMAFGRIEVWRAALNLLPLPVRDLSTLST